MPSEEWRADRIYESDRRPDNRNDFQRDRDRILYTGAFRRLAGTSQVVSAAEGHQYHNRLTHTLEVAQVARRTAELLLRGEPSAALLEAVGGLNADVVEAAALGHDLGHPPFGHIGEQALDEIVCDKECGKDPDGFEGNAQSFRIVTSLAVRNASFLGLNLTYATLNGGMVKYPWPREAKGKKHDKFAFYSTEADIFAEIRRDLRDPSVRTAEAEVMDWADEITYAVHDLYDFARSGLIPLGRLVESDSEFSWFLKRVDERWKRLGINRDYSSEEKNSIRGVLALCPLDNQNASHGHRAALRTYSSLLIARYVNLIRLVDPLSNGGKCILVPRLAKIQLDMLKELTWVYVIEAPALASIQHGQRRVVETLYRTFFEDAGNRLLPVWAKELLDAGTQRSRVVADVVSGLTEDRAIHLFNRLTGQCPGSLLDPLY